MVPSFLNGDHGDQWFYLIKSKKNWDTHLDNPTKGQGWRGCCKFPKLFTSYFQLYSQNFSEKSILSILALPPKEIFQLFLLKKTLTLETTDGTVWALNQNGKFAKHMARRLGQSRQSAWAPSGNSGLRVRVTWAARPRCRTWLGHALALCPWASHSTSLWLFVHLQNKDNNSISVQICKILSTVPLAHSRHFFFFFWAPATIVITQFYDNYGSLRGATGRKTHR